MSRRSVPEPRRDAQTGAATCRGAAALSPGWTGRRSCCFNASPFSASVPRMTTRSRKPLQTQAFYTGESRAVNPAFTASDRPRCRDALASGERTARLGLSSIRRPSAGRSRLTPPRLRPNTFRHRVARNAEPPPGDSSGGSPKARLEQPASPQPSMSRRACSIQRSAPIRPGKPSSCSSQTTSWGARPAI